MVLAKLGPNASFPSGDGAAAVSFALPLAHVGWPIAATILVVLACVGRVYFLAHHVLDTVVGVTITYLCYMALHASGCGIGDADWWQPILAHVVFVTTALFRKSDHK
jgi:membrane-associated phospholipid phosphatase